VTGPAAGGAVSGGSWSVAAVSSPLCSRSRQDGPRTLHGLGHLAVEAEAHHRYEIGPFVVTFVPSVHAKLLAGVKVPSGCEITCEHVGELRPDGYGCRQVWGVRIEVAG
jgi:hypothetical protein